MYNSTTNLVIISSAILLSPEVSDGSFKVIMSLLSNVTTPCAKSLAKIVIVAKIKNKIYMYIYILLDNYVYKPEIKYVV